jgi:hypothetical protein
MIPRSLHRLRAAHPRLPLPLNLALGLGVTSEELARLIVFARHHPARLRVGLFERLSTPERGLLHCGLTTATLMLALAAAGLPSRYLLIPGSAVLACAVLFLRAYPWRVRSTLLQRALDWERSLPAPYPPGAVKEPPR